MNKALNLKENQLWHAYRIGYLKICSVRKFPAFAYLFYSNLGIACHLDLKLLVFDRMFDEQPSQVIKLYLYYLIHTKYMWLYKTDNLKWPYCYLQGQLCDLRLWFGLNGKMIGICRIMKIIRIQLNPHKYLDRVTHPFYNNVTFVKILEDYLVICIESHSYAHGMPKW